MVFLKVSCSVESEIYANEIFVVSHYNSLVLCCTWNRSVIHVWSFNILNCGSLGYASLSNVDTFHYTISKTTYIDITINFIWKVYVLGNYLAHSGGCKFSEILISALLLATNNCHLLCIKCLGSHHSFLRNIHPKLKYK